MKLETERRTNSRHAPRSDNVEEEKGLLKYHL